MCRVPHESPQIYLGFIAYCPASTPCVVSRRVAPSIGEGDGGPVLSLVLFGTQSRCCVSGSRPFFSVPMRFIGTGFVGIMPAQAVFQKTFIRSPSSDHRNVPTQNRKLKIENFQSFLSLHPT